ncbi:hypothetical protein RYA95_26550 [Pseudomonas syringae pv. actinidiae]|jgi:hypothetical protein|uniref:DUF6957 family protein n=1 Tax=Pseudomonas syringae TaxID=317 RepID=UPI00034886F4|nr:hypothetical protein [Pseudomonas syringae]AYL80361.1 hypothetical protein CN228_10695 [Pseudomonas syringae pv. actinidiae str. Shaanxi_M228]MDU8616589.1 hypothetical protein [Pseudomonas syringae pv. actinidiae]OSN76787.1 hypothetical protein BV352_05384 [Pseudomonas syringae pv. actinidiae]
MSDIDVQQMIGPSAVMHGAGINLEEAIRVTQEKFPDRSFCIVNEWVWLDLDAPDLVVEELALEGMQPIMLLVFDVLVDSSTNAKSRWFRSTPMMDFTDGMFFQTQHKLYVLLGNGRRKSMSLSAVVRLF